MPDGRVEVPVLWKDDNLRPPSNFEAALARWEKQEKSLARNPEVRRRYDEVIQEWERKGYVEKITGPFEPSAFYIPHFPVIREDKKTTKVRIVMDCKASFGGGLSLNDCVMQGPKVINSLFNVLLHFRTHKYALIADAQEMFLRLRLRPEDAVYHRFIYSPLREKSYCVYQSRSHVFGNRGSLTNAVATVKLEALKQAEKFPLAARVVLHGSLVDDNLASVETEEEASLVVKGLNSIYGACGIQLHKWVTNLTDAGSLQQPEFEFREYDDEGVQDKALGVFWNTSKDSFSFRYPAPSQHRWTKRLLLKKYMAIYDPQGWILPFVMLARIAYRDTWREKLEWDEEVPRRLQITWNKWFAQLPELSAIEVPRSFDQCQESQLHTFVDASGEGYGAVAYMVSATGSRMVAARGKVNSDVGKTIPKLELLAACLGVKLAAAISEALKIPSTSMWYWGDSMNVLSWIRAPGREIDRFCARKAAQIRQLTDPSRWRYVNTSENPADLVTRGATAEKLANNSLWWNGPDFLPDPDGWPKTEIKVTQYEDLPDEQELRKLIGIYHSSSGILVDPFAKFSELNMALSVMRQVLQFIWLVKRSTLPRPTMVNARTALITWSQKQSWPSEYATLEAGQELPLGHLWNQFDYCLQDRCIMLSGRTRRTPVPLLHKDSHLALIWLRDIHVWDLRHAGGPQVLLAESRKQFWVLRGTNVCKGVVRSCVTCRRRQPQSASQRMAPLPEHRYSPMEGDGSHFAFETVAIDIAGPYMTSQGRGRAKAKRYLLLFCCPLFRAVHFEILYGEGTSDVLMALQRFASRRGMPKQVISDNGTQFHRASIELKNVRSLIKSGVVQVSQKWQDVIWLFNPPRMPHTGGVFESLVKSAKTAFKAVVGNVGLTDEQLLTGFVYAEDLLNKRPLAVLPSDANDPDPLTPAHFLAGSRVPELGLLDLNGNTDYVNAWQKMNEIRDKFWQRFLVEFIPTLESRTKWQTGTECLKVGDVVVSLENGKTSQGRWPLGVVQEVRTNPNDRLVRTVVVRIGKELFKRHVKSLMPLF